VEETANMKTNRRNLKIDEQTSPTERRGSTHSYFRVSEYGVAEKVTEPGAQSQVIESRPPASQIRHWGINE
jgi:hypothetical protein